MSNLTKQIKNFTKTEDEEAESILEQARKWCKSNNELTNPVKPEEPFNIMTPDEIETEDPLAKMTFFSAWINYYSMHMSNWKSIVSYLDGLYETLTKQYMITSTNEKETSDKKKESAAKVLYSPIQRAKQKAEKKYFDFKSKLETANLQFQLCSRIITFRGDELRNTR